MSCSSGKPGVDGHAGLGKSDRHDRLRQIGPLAHAKSRAVQRRFAAFLHRPQFVAHRIVNHADNNFALATQRDRNAKMRDAVKIIHRAIERIDHPLIIARLVADNSFFAVKRVLGKFLQAAIRVISSCARTSISSLMSCASAALTRQRLMKMCAQQIAGGARRFDRGVEIMRHRRMTYIGSRSALPNDFTPSAVEHVIADKKTGRRN